MAAAQVQELRHANDALGRRLDAAASAAPAVDAADAAAPGTVGPGYDAARPGPDPRGCWCIG